MNMAEKKKKVQGFTLQKKLTTVVLACYIPSYIHLIKGAFYFNMLKCLEEILWCSDNSDSKTASTLKTCVGLLFTTQKIDQESMKRWTDKQN